MAVLEEIARALRNAADKAAAAAAPLVAAGQFAQVKPAVAELLERLDAAQKGIVSALVGDGAPAKESQTGGTGVALTAVLASAPPTPQPELPWDEQQRRTLPAHITSGRYFDDDGHSDLVQSGSEPDGEHERINDYLIENGIIDPKRIGTTKHVEMKVAWRMRQGGPTTSTSSSTTRSAAASCPAPSCCHGCSAQVRCCECTIQ